MGAAEAGQWEGKIGQECLQSEQNTPGGVVAAATAKEMPPAPGDGHSDALDAQTQTQRAQRNAEERTSKGRSGW